MGHSRVPLYAYVDETGNTGHNIFDETQPDFFTAALVTAGDFDLAHSGTVRQMAQAVGMDTLHGKELGVGRIENISTAFLQMLKVSKASFFVSRVEKKYLLATKVFDTIFDSGENAAVAWHHYNLRALRLTLTFKLAATLTYESARMFWACILEKKEEKVHKQLVETCKIMLEDLARLKDKRAFEIFEGGLKWAMQYPETLQIHTDRKIARLGHFPNMVAFVNLLDGLELRSKQTGRAVERITHDEQSEFQKSLATWHEMFSHASPEIVHWAGESYSLQKVSGSQFQVLKDSMSAGIQVTDVVLWLYSQMRKQKTVPRGCGAIMQYVFETGWENDFSFTGVERVLLDKQGDKMFGPLSLEREAEAREMLKKLDTSRLSSMERYQHDRLPPFMRSSRQTTEISDLATNIPDATAIT